MNELQKDAHAFKESQRQYFDTKRGTNEHSQAVCKMDELICNHEAAGSLNQFMAIVNGESNG